MKIIDDLFKTAQPDGTLKWDMTNPAWMVTPVLGGVCVYIGMGIFSLIAHPQSFDLMKYAGGFGALISGSGIGVMFHSRANN